MEDLKEIITKKDEQIDRMNNLLCELLKQATDAQAQARYSSIWSNRGGNLW